MKVKVNSTDRLVFVASRVPAGIAGIAVSPLFIWLGQMIVEEDDAAWLGWIIGGLGILMIVLGALSVFKSVTLTLDRRLDMIRLSQRFFTRRRNQIMPLSELAAVEKHVREIRQTDYSYLAFLPKPESSAKQIDVTEFWTQRSAESAYSEIQIWLSQTR